MPKLTKRTPKKCPQGKHAVLRIDGQKIYLGTWNTKAAQRNYDRIVGESISNGRRLPPQDTADVTIIELILQFWRYAKQHYRKGDRHTCELHNYKRALQYLKELYGFHRRPRVLAAGVQDGSPSND